MVGDLPYAGVGPRKGLVHVFQGGEAPRTSAFDSPRHSVDAPQCQRMSNGASWLPEYVRHSCNTHGAQLGQFSMSRCRITKEATRIAHLHHGRYHLREHTLPYEIRTVPAAVVVTRTATLPDTSSARTNSSSLKSVYGRH
ncbi:hypothetical protein LshimejAT787_0701100 [Lyophyllum shimeji]|uniref:Uncharacterized protein n=1 Tax=Lyophyllum shimeji TaxID=47721 RepID=A0A9P3PND4_LYOSH|nr:hypothetical protein LshimejAT787_0701100 [Lyophyllum shimeji]